MLQLSENAEKQARQRGISRGTIHLIGHFADQRVRVPGGAIALSITERATRRLGSTGMIAPKELERCAGVVVIADMASRTVITAEHCLRRRHRLN